MIYTVIDHFDLWGNSSQGYEVNDSRNAGEIELPEEATDLEILATLVLDNHIDAQLPEEEHLFEIDGDDLMILVNGPSTDKPPVMVPYFTLVVVASAINQEMYGGEK